MVRLVAVACAIALSGCATAGVSGGETLAAGGLSAAGPVGVTTARSGLEGKQLDAALGRYGVWSERMTLQGMPTYIWRRSMVADSQAFYCELRVETAFRQTISRSVMQGYPQACQLFAARTQG